MVSEAAGCAGAANTPATQDGWQSFSAQDYNKLPPDGLVGLSGTLRAGFPEAAVKALTVELLHPSNGPVTGTVLTPGLVAGSKKPFSGNIIIAFRPTTALQTIQPIP